PRVFYDAAHVESMGDRLERDLQQLWQEHSKERTPTKRSKTWWSSECVAVARAAAAAQHDLDEARH
ncbi:predicted protein, partial [Postia placenta Mad-698-R]